MKFFIIIFSLLLSTCLFSQEEQMPGTYRIQTKDGNEYYGRIVSQDAESVTLETEQLGVIRIPKIKIKKMTLASVGQDKDGEYWFQNPQSTRYFWQPNGYGLKKGEGYYQNVWILFNQVSVGVTDHFQIGAGMVPLFLFAGEPTPVWLTPKFSIPIKKDAFNMGAGALIGTVIGESEASFGIAYGTATVGSRDKNLSLGVGYGFAGGEFANAPTITLSGMLRTGQRGYLLTENYFMSGGGGDDVILFFVGGRRLIQNAGIDFGLMIPSFSEGSFVAIPWLGLTIPFGNK